MAKNVIKKLFPKLDSIKEQKILKIFGPAVLQPNLWHINKKSVARGIAIGTFCAFLPIPGQMMVAVFLAIIFAANLPLSLILTWISNPVTFTPILYLEYTFGKYFIETDSNHVIKNEGLNLISDIMHMGLPLLLGSLIFAVIGSMCSYILIRLYWRYYVKKIWDKRKK
jgi:uncharacterized protein (DUF2062 family)